MSNNFCGLVFVVLMMTSIVMTIRRDDQNVDYIHMSYQFNEQLIGERNIEYNDINSNEG